MVKIKTNWSFKEFAVFAIKYFFLGLLSGLTFGLVGHLQINLLGQDILDSTNVNDTLGITNHVSYEVRFEEYIKRYWAQSIVSGILGGIGIFLLVFSITQLALNPMAGLINVLFLILGLISVPLFAIYNMFLKIRIVTEGITFRQKY